MFRTVAMVSSLFLFIAGCSTTEDFEKKLASWVGSSERELISTWGPPHRAYESGNTKYLTWNQSGAMTLPGTQPTYSTTVIGNTAYTNAYGGTPPTTINLNCETTFEVQDGVISGWRWQGNNCS